MRKVLILSSNTEGKQKSDVEEYLIPVRMHTSMRRKFAVV